MVGRRQKPPEYLQGRGSRYVGDRSIALVPPDERRIVPPCPRGVTEQARRWFRSFCDDPISQLVTEAAWPKVLRLVVLLSKREVVEKQIWDAPTVEGSMGQPTINPLVTYLKELNREIEKIEQGLGLLPVDRVRLGIAVVQRQSGVEDLRRRLSEGGGTPRRRVYGTAEEATRAGEVEALDATGEDVVDLDGLQ